MELRLVRTETSDEGTFGYLYRPGNPPLATAEPPWRDNKIMRSCIPPGTYKIKLRRSKKYKKHYKVLGVPGRTWILIHWGNYAGDGKKGYKFDTRGCILVGMQHGHLSGQKVVLSSRAAMAELLDCTLYDTLVIEESYNG